MACADMVGASGLQIVWQQTCLAEHIRLDRKPQQLLGQFLGKIGKLTSFPMAA